MLEGARFHRAGHLNYEGKGLRMCLAVPPFPVNANGKNIGHLRIASLKMLFPMTITRPLV